VRVSHRLLLTLLPALVGLLAVVGLTYWGQYERQAPHFAVATAIIALGVSVALAFRNARYLASRIEQLASSSGTQVTDELDTIAGSLDQMRADVVTARKEALKGHEHAENERRELSTVLSEAAESASRAVDEIRLPLHILLENRFGDLNENQEEMLGSAQASAEEASALFARLRVVADLERGAIELRRDPLRVDDIVRGLLPTLQNLGERRGVRVDDDLAPALPRVSGDRTHLQELVSVLLRSAVDRTADNESLRIGVEASSGHLRVTASHGPGPLRLIDKVLAERLAAAMGISLNDSDGSTVLEFPAVLR
jgi:hypothetical protein